MKQFSKIKHLADKAFVRPDRTEVLSEALLDAERRIELIKQTCEITAKKVSGCLSQGKEMKDGTAIEKRIKKVPEFILGSNMVEYGSKLGISTSLGEVLEEAGKIEMKVGSEMVEYEDKIEKLVLIPLQKVIQDDLPSIYKLKRNLSKLTENMDIARGKLGQASVQSGPAAGDKIANFKEEVEECQFKVEQCRSNLAAEMYQLIAREPEIAQYIVSFLKFQLEYHTKMASTLSELLPEVNVILTNASQNIVFGTDLTQHLTATQRTIAGPIELCVCGLLDNLEEEGLFRMAGSSSKVKKLKSAFDAALVDLNVLTHISDPHVISNALKCYLRELPNPLLTIELYDEWVKAIRTNDNQERLQALWKVVQQLPENNLTNLRYLIKFLKELSNRQNVNKMSPSNIAIVIGPNLLWNLEDGDSLTMTHLFSSIVEQLISYSDWFFPGDIEFYITCKKPVEEELSDGPGTRLENGSTIQETSDDSTQPGHKRSQSTSSLDSPPQGGSPKPVLRRKNKQAPGPPAQKSMSTSESYRDSLSIVHSHTTTTTGIEPRVESPSTRQTDKRDGGFHIPPSPCQMKTSTGTSEQVLKTGPPKPPQPIFSKESHKSSFRCSSRTGSTENEESGGSSRGSTSLHYSVSLPRHFHTENSYKNLTNIKSPVVPNQTESTVQSAKDTPPTPLKVVNEIETQPEKIESYSLINPMTTESRPVPAPRSSLIISSQGINNVQKERPTLMAKPRDLNKKRTTIEINNIGDKINLPVDNNPIETDNKELPKEKDLVEPEEIDKSLGNPSRHSQQFRPPRPQPPPPPKAKAPAESTHL